MKVSLNTVRQYIDFDLPSIDELVKRINSQLGQIESVTDLSQIYKDVVVVRVVSCEKHPDADRLSVCIVDDGGVVQDIERNADGHVQVVCGAPNVHADMFAAWLPPRATVPSSYGTSDPFILDTRELRGVKSSGMLAAADELALGSDHGGIIEIDPDQWRPSDAVIAPGASFAEVFGLNDTIIDIENKMFTHRPDLFGQLGIAREIAGILGHEFKDPDWYWSAPQFSDAQGLELHVTNDAGDKCPRFTAVVLKDITIKPSPLWLQIELVRMGGKPINNIVDVTNYVMLLTAQPTHAYDYDALKGSALSVRMAHANETCTLLNGKTYQLTEDDIVIVDGEGIVGLGGVMGGAGSEVSETTRNIVLEVATFDMYSIRKTSMRHGIFTDAVTRFNKGQSSLQQPHVLSLLMQSVHDVAGGEQASSVFDLGAVAGKLESEASADITISPQFINDRLGLNLTAQEIVQFLSNVRFACRIEAPDVLVVAKPFWRTDIDLPEDIVEEIGRLHGFDTLPREMPMRTSAPAAEHVGRTLKQKMREALRRAGANEVLTYSFVHEKVLEYAGQDSSQAYALSNALSPELQYYRLTVLPSLLDKVHMNIKAGYDAFVLFEIGKGHSKRCELDEDGLPNESEYLDIVFAQKQPSDGAPYYHARRQVEYVLKTLGIQVSFNPVDESGSDVSAPFEPSRSAAILTRDGVSLGIVGELRSQVRTSFKLPEYVACASISIDALLALPGTYATQYVPLPRFPSIARDISLRTKQGVAYSELASCIEAAASAGDSMLSVHMEPISAYMPKEDNSLKTTTFHLEFTHRERTLQDADVNPIIDAIVASSHQSFGAELV